ncbi:probable ADP-ribosylation factor GTPase-activating protein AGD15 [Punica granatum]|uniref:Probable ADP-ribosylation factor GTPase-activating protein AGD15 n=1 Tax=Punica granatum TaxID=22663 RepID=A0A6P8E853_PUNGR|nr:probable ADP-ribosylation factor GTPase-activating protein AGD15 [Punica granatum]XP_031403486.1 probable ADP-ribosylation factor GTPase-activating protein AGD15 [Punica granatum]XP_031403487.1 probable ADP-ribosylation factor GTPase-activating protein AGD15 [Punica granatum]XP_031403488.1 probable ADP-ribosylation factor GTPase-activating protein AGD15 [Punica granatum]
MMNEKALVTKDLNAKHTKILEGLLKLPENRECADCRNKAPRWASVNLGAFICMQCSGIHRSLGVHISKVRSTSLDTWLPEQVAFMQCMGNKKSNDYWEAELPVDYDRSMIERFIRAKYVEGRWAAKDVPQPSPELCDMYSVTTDFLDGGSKDHNTIGKTRRFSLDEEILTKHMTQVAPPQKQRGISVDMKDDPLPLARPPTDEPAGTSVKTRSQDLFSLLYSRDANRCPRPPSSWATFD